MAGIFYSWGLRWRSKRNFIVATVAIGLFTDLFLYGIVVPVLPFMLRDRLAIPEAEIQEYTSLLLAAYAGASAVFSIPAGWIADRIGSRQPTFLAGLVFLLAATVLLGYGRSIVTLVTARLLQGISVAVVWTTGLAMVQDTVGQGQIGHVIGTIFSIISVGELVAPVLGGILYDIIGIPAVFGVSIGILAIDLAMRLLVLDPRTVPKHSRLGDDENPTERDFQSRTEEREGEAREDDSLIPRNRNEGYKVNGHVGNLSRVIPILYCFHNPRLVMAMLLSFVQASLIGIFDATVPIEVASLFHFSSLKVGVLFIAIVVPTLALGRVAGFAVDRYGTKAVATIGYAFLVPCLVLLGLPSQKVIDGDGNVSLFCVALALNGVGLSIIGSPALVEASDVVRSYEVANPGFFGENGAYAQLYGFNSLFFFAGLTAGPLVGGMLRVNFGYGVMTAASAVMSGLTAVLSFFLIGERSR